MKLLLLAIAACGISGVFGHFELILSQRDVTVARFIKATFEAPPHQYLMNENDPDALLFSILGRFTPGKQNQYKVKDSNGNDAFRFKVVYDNLNPAGTSDTLEWTQTNWPLGTKTITGYQAINVPDQTGVGPSAVFRGLAESDADGHSLLDGNGGSGSWWNAVGTYINHGPGIPAFHQRTGKGVKLYIYRAVNPGNAANFPPFSFDDCYIGDELLIDDPKFRSVDGSGNNKINNDWGAAGIPLLRKNTIPAYGDGVNTMAGADRPNPRELSNVFSRIVDETSQDVLNSRDLTQFAWQWGQFIDHDITLVSEDGSENDDNQDQDIVVPCSDPDYDVGNDCDASKEIEFFRTLVAEGGDSAANPRNQKNDITAFIDGSMIYGSDAARAEALREFEFGRLKTSDNDLLPFNEANLCGVAGEGCPNAPGDFDSFYVAGDVRANEQLGLLAMHTLFVRAHNMLAADIIPSVRANNFGAADDKIDELTYQYAKLVLTACIQKITYKDWLPASFGRAATDRILGDYSRYDDTENPGIWAMFASAVFRYGHAMLPQKLPLRNDECGDPRDIGLKDAFFHPQTLTKFAEDGVSEAFFVCIARGFSCTKCNEVDTRATDAVRNNLFESAVDPESDGDADPDNDPRIFGILDLISLNIQRGRDFGLPDYNSVREEFGLPKKRAFNHECEDEELVDGVEAGIWKELCVEYGGDVDNIDLFLGMLAEPHVTGGSYGELVTKIVLQQFKRIRDGDRYYYENYIKDGPLRRWIDGVTLADILTKTANVDLAGGVLKGNKYGKMNVFQNSVAEGIFASGGQPSIYSPSSWFNGNETLLVLTNKQMLLILALIASVIGVFCVFWCRIYKKNPYQVVKFDTDTESQSDDV